jgi:hypothetical protein
MEGIMKNLELIDTRKLFRKNAEELLNLLSSLHRKQWLSPTCYPNWKVRDIAVHLFQTGLGRLSKQRDKFPDSGMLPSLEFNQLNGIIFNSNESWNILFKNISPELITGLLTISELELCSLIEALPLEEEAFFPVAWAGDTVSQNWFDIAREWTERWHHHQQIREALGAESLTQREFLFPVIDTLIRAVPWWYSSLAVETGTQIRVNISGNSGGLWTIIKTDDIWLLKSGISDEKMQAEIELSDDTAWRFLTRSISVPRARNMIKFKGDSRLAEHFLHVKAIMMAD